MLSWELLLDRLTERGTSSRSGADPHQLRGLIQRLEPRGLSDARLDMSAPTSRPRDAHLRRMVRDTVGTAAACGLAQHEGPELGPTSSYHRRFFHFPDAAPALSRAGRRVPRAALFRRPQSGRCFAPGLARWRRTDRGDRAGRLLLAAVRTQPGGPSTKRARRPGRSTAQATRLAAQRRGHELRNARQTEPSSVSLGWVAPRDRTPAPEAAGPTVRRDSSLTTRTGNPGRRARTGKPLTPPA